MRCRTDVADRLKSLIPGLPNRLVVGALRFFSLFTFISKKKRKLHLEENKNLQETGLIEDQNALKSLPFGNTDMAYAGCEVIAVYNLLQDLGKSISLNVLIETFEKRGAVFNGFFGTSPYALYRYLKKSGLDAVCSSARKNFDRIAKESRSFIITYYNDAKNIMNMVHTICVTKDENGRLIPHNCVCAGQSFDDIFNLEKKAGVQDRAKMIFILGIRQEGEKHPSEQG